MHYKRKRCRRYGTVKLNWGNHKKTSWDYHGGERYERMYHKYRKFEGWDYES